MCISWKISMELLAPVKIELCHAPESLLWIYTKHVDCSPISFYHTLLIHTRRLVRLSIRYLSKRVAQNACLIFSNLLLSKNKDKAKPKPETAAMRAKEKRFTSHLFRPHWRSVSIRLRSGWIYCCWTIISLRKMIKCRKGVAHAIDCEKKPHSKHLPHQLKSKTKILLQY